MAQTRIFTLGPQSFPVGTFTRGPFTLPQRVTSLRIGVTRANLPANAADCGRCTIEYSIDGGATWHLAIGMTFGGDPTSLGPDGNVATDSWAEERRPQGVPQGTQIRGTLQVFRPFAAALWAEFGA